MKRIITILLCLAMVFTLYACGSKTEPETTTLPEATAAPEATSWRIHASMPCVPKR